MNPPCVIPEKLATFYEHSSGKYLPDISEIACGYNGAYLEMIVILKYVLFEYLINIWLSLILINNNCELDS